MAKKLTIEQILFWDPCEEEYDTKQKIIDATDSDWPKTPLEIAALDIPMEDRLWVLLRPEIIPEKLLHLLACDFADDVLPIFENEYPDDKRPQQAIDAKRRWVAGEISDEELEEAWEAAKNTDYSIRTMTLFGAAKAAVAARMAARINAEQAANYAAWAARLAKSTFATKKAGNDKREISEEESKKNRLIWKEAGIEIAQKQLARVVEVLKCLVK